MDRRHALPGPASPGRSGLGGRTLGRRSDRPAPALLRAERQGPKSAARPAGSVAGGTADTRQTVGSMPMVDLERRIAQWRQTMASSLGERADVLDELETHLREEVERRVLAGEAPITAFEAAAQRLGNAPALAA